MDVQFDETQQMLRKAARSFAEEFLAEYVPRMEKEDRIPPEVLQEIAGRDFLALLIPEEYGGLQAGYLARLLVLEEIARVSAATAMLIEVLHLGAYLVDLYGTAEQKQKYLARLASGKLLAGLAVTESTGGSDPTAMQTVARKEGGSYILNGRKVFITASHLAGLVSVVAKMEDDPGSFTIFLLDQDCPGWRPGREEKKMGFKGSNTGELIMEDCRVPAENILGQVGEGLKLALSGISEMSRTGMMAVASGIITAALEEAVKFSNQRLSGGKPINRNQAIQWKIADIYADLETSRLLAYKAASMQDRGERADLEIAMGKYYTAEAVVRAAKNACDIHGAYAYIEEYPVQRLLRDAHLCIASSGTTEIMKMVTARAVIKKFS